MPESATNTDMLPEGDIVVNNSILTGDATAEPTETQASGTDSQEAEAEAQTTSNSLLTTEPEDKIEWTDFDFTNGKPDDLPAHYWDEEKGEVNVNAVLKDKAVAENRAENLRKTLGKKGNEAVGEVPKDISGYTLAIPEGVEIADDDPLLTSIKETALEQGISADAFNKLMSLAYQKTYEFSQSEEFGKSAEEIEANVQAEKQAEISKLGKNGSAVIESVTAWLDGKVAQGEFTAGDAQALKDVAITADAVKALNRLRISDGGDPNVVLSTGIDDVEATKAEVLRLASSEKFNEGDPATIKKYEQLVKQLTDAGVSFR